MTSTVIIQLPPLDATYWPISFAHAYTVPLCLSSWRLEQMNYRYPFWKHYVLKKYKPELSIQKQFSIAF